MKHFDFRTLKEEGIHSFLKLISRDVINYTVPGRWKRSTKLVGALEECYIPESVKEEIYAFYN